ncbi:MAG: amidohydrolase family protein [Pseudomonadota bacterium]
MKIDAHQHFWAMARGDYGWMEGNPAAAPIRRDVTPAEMRPLLDAHGIDATVLVQAAPTVAETHYMLGLADATDWVAKVVGWIDFEREEDRTALTQLADHPKFAGVRPMIQDIPDDNWMHRPDIAWAYDAIRDLDLSFDALGLPRHLERFLRLFERYPDMRAVVDHCMKPAIRDGAFDDWAAWMARIAAETPVYCKLSALATEAKADWTPATLEPYARHILEVFGPDRTLWGSDWPVLTLNSSYAAWHDAAQGYVPEAHRAAVFGGTAAAFYRIEA